MRRDGAVTRIQSKRLQRTILWRLVSGDVAVSISLILESIVSVSERSDAKMDERSAPFCYRVNLVLRKKYYILSIVRNRNNHPVDNLAEF